MTAMLNPKPIESATVRVTNSIGACPWWPRTDSRELYCYAFQRAEILESWCRSFARARRIEPIFVSVFAENGEPALLLPLGIEEHTGVRALRFLDAGVSDYNAPAVSAETASWTTQRIQDFWADLQRRLPAFDIALFDKMPEFVESVRNPIAALASSRHPESCHVASLPDTWDAFVQSHRFNAPDSRRRLRKLEKLGRVRFVVAETEQERQAFFEAMVRFKRRKFIETKGYDAFGDPGFGEFYADATRELGGNRALHVSALLLEDTILAAHWGYVVGPRFYQLMPAHASDEWRAYSPGRLLNEWLIAWSIERKLKLFDFGIGDEPYKFDYSDIHIPLHDSVLPITVKGRLFAAAWNLKHAAKNSLRDTKVGEVLKLARRQWRARGSETASDSGT